ncbi:hypothetical protein HS125_11580 [bacterium]|nr:hypothetical protein [bacterium]
MWHSRLLPRYSRRTEAEEEGVIRTYLGGCNTRRIEQPLSPVLEGAGGARQQERGAGAGRLCTLRAEMSG